MQPEIHELRGHRGQIDVAAAMRALMDGSEIRESHREGDTRVQDPYCIRCQPQVTGAAIDLIRQAGRTLEIEANAVTDNPLVLEGAGIIVSGGNFHAEPVAFAADTLALAIAEIGAIAQRRIAMMVDPALSFDLPPFLTPDPGLNSGYMIAEVTTAALMSENKHLANPCSTDSTPTSANQEDHVSMAAHGARRLMRMTPNLASILGVELLCASQGIECRAPLQDQSGAAEGAGAAARRCAVAGRRPLHGNRNEDRRQPRRLGRRGARDRLRPPDRLEYLTMTTNPRHNLRDVYPPTGPEITAKHWVTEAPMRMLMNNLHPDVAENPHELVVYGGIGRAARTWDDFDRIVASLKTLE